MSAKNNATILGVGVAACAVCCAGPILAALAANGLGTAAGLALFGTFAVLVGAALALVVLAVRRRHGIACTTTNTSEPVHVELADVVIAEATAAEMPTRVGPSALAATPGRPSGVSVPVLAS